MLKVVFWALVAVDLLGILLLFVLGLAAAGSTKDNPAQVALVLLVLPCLPLAGSVVLFLRATSPVGRGVAVLLAAAPVLILVSARGVAEVMMRANTNEQGEMTFFRSGPKREIAEAIARNDARTVASLVTKRNVNATGLMGVTPLMLAVRRLRDTPEQHEVLRAGANPNQTTSFGDPVWFDATGQSSSLEALALLLDRGANIDAMAKDESTALFSAARARNWKAALLLLQRGADWRRGKSVNGMPFANLVDGYVGTESGDSAFQSVRRLVQ